MESKLENLVKEVELEIRDQIAEIDERCMRNSLRVLNAFQKNRIADVHFNSTSGYGYDDIGRDTIEKFLLMFSYRRCISEKSIYIWYSCYYSCIVC